MGGKLTEEEKKQAGVEAGRQVRRETLDACRALKLSPAYVLKRLKSLSRAKTVKPHYEPNRIKRDKETNRVILAVEGGWVYSDPLHDNRTQLEAIKELAVILGMHATADDQKPPKPNLLADLARALSAGPAASEPDPDQEPDAD